MKMSGGWESGRHYIGMKIVVGMFKERVKNKMNGSTHFSFQVDNFQYPFETSYNYYAVNMTLL